VSEIERLLAEARANAATIGLVRSDIELTPGASDLPALLAQARANRAQARANAAAWKLKIATFLNGLD